VTVGLLVQVPSHVARLRRLHGHLHEGGRSLDARATAILDRKVRLLAPASASPDEPAASLDRIRQTADARASDATVAFASAQRSADRTSLAVLVVAAVCGGMVVTMLSVTVSQGLATLEDASRHMASGDYAYRIPIAHQDEFGRAGATFNRMAEQLATAIEEASRDRRELQRRRARVERPRGGEPAACGVDVARRRRGGQHQEAVGQQGFATHVHRRVGVARSRIECLCLREASNAHGVMSRVERLARRGHRHVGRGW
jgi:HAMP domain-containing protein